MHLNLVRGRIKIGCGRIKIGCGRIEIVHGRIKPSCGRMKIDRGRMKIGRGRGKKLSNAGFVDEYRKPFLTSIILFTPKQRDRQSAY